MFPVLPRTLELEEDVRRSWERHRTFQRSMAQREGAAPWVFFEGPPTANGTPHNGHVLTRVLKDVFPRFQTMRGKLVRRKAGWDTHGLPVEVEVEKQLDVHGKAAIEAFGLDAFSRACRDNVFTYIQEWNELTRDIGMWLDLDDAYVTYHRAYVESVWWALSRLFDKGLLYQGHKVVWWWPQGGTTLSAAEVGLGYKTVDDPAATVRFRDADDPSRSYLAWTTTPWTVPSNVALAVHRDVTYAICDDPDGGEVVVAEALAASYDLVPKATVLGAALLGKRYQPPFSWATPEGGAAFAIVHGDHVTTKSGTGIVHTAPAYGEDDMAVARAEGLGLLQLVGPDGTFGPEAGELQGVFCKAADAALLRELKARGLLFKRDTYRHDYPFCWRASSDPLIQFARPAWFIRTTAVKDAAIANNAAVDWHPDHIRDGRMGDFLRNNVDWALSRERFWGTPLNIWTCEACEHRVAPASVADLVARGATGLATDVDEDLAVHRPWIDAVKLPCPSCGGTMHRVPEVIDCWFDSGSMPFAQWGFPHQGREAFLEQFPADFICEAIDQTRGWFYTLQMIATLVFDEETAAALELPYVGQPRPYRSCVVLGHVTDRHGFKESKSKGNYTSPNLVMRGETWQIVRADPEVAPGTVGLQPAQVEGLELGEAPVHVSASRGADGLALRLAPAAVKAKDTVHLHPDDLSALGVASGERAWLKLPSEPPGADAFRWLFCAASPPSSNTRLSLRAIRESQREFLIRLRNVYQFFSIYANIAAAEGRFDPHGAPPRPMRERADLDRWLGHQLLVTAETVTDHLEAYRLYDAARALIAFSDDLSNWYVRRSRARFWGEGADTEDALWTLYEVLRELSTLVAPFVPFLADALWRGLMVAPGLAPEDASVHLQDWPRIDPSWRDDELAADMALARQVASLGLATRNQSKIKVRQPLAAATVVLADSGRAPALERFAALVTDELNVREVRLADDAGAFVTFHVKPDYRALGPRLGKGVKAVAAALAKLPGHVVKAGLDAGTLAVDVDGERVSLSAAEVDVRVEAKGSFEAASGPDAVVALHTGLDDDLRAEGFVRELLNRVQTARKEADLGYTDRIALALDLPEAQADAVRAHQATLCGESLCTSLTLSEGEGEAAVWDVDGVEVRAWLRRA